MGQGAGAGDRDAVRFTLDRQPVGAGLDCDALGRTEQAEFRILPGLIETEARAEDRDHHQPVADDGILQIDLEARILDRHEHPGCAAFRYLLARFDRRRGRVGDIIQLDGPDVVLAAHHGILHLPGGEMEDGRPIVGDLLGLGEPVAELLSDLREIHLGRQVEHDPELARALDHGRRRRIGPREGHANTILALPHRDLESSAGSWRPQD